MRKTLLIIILFLSTFLVAHSQTCSNSFSVSLKADTTGGKFYTLQLNNNFPTTSTPNTLFEGYAWTNNAGGYPIWTGRTISWFDLSSIPTNAIITSATLYAYADTSSSISGYPNGPTYGSTNAGFLQRVTSSYDKTGLTTGWNNAPAISTSDEKVVPQSTNQNENYALDITDFAQLWVSKPDSNFGMMLRLQNENYYNRLTFYSYNSPVDSFNLRLDISYTLPNASSISLFADTTNREFYTLQLNNNFPSTSIPNTLFEGYAWTNNAGGYPIWTGRTISWFNLSSAIPQNSTIISATLYAHADTSSSISGYPNGPTYGSANAGYLQRVISSYNKNGDTTGWNNAPSVSIADEKILAQSTSQDENYLSDITDFVQLWVNQPDSNFGMMLRLQNENYYNRLTFYSFDSPVDSLNLRLNICYVPNLSIVPLYLVEFNGILDNNVAKLTWASENEINISTFYVQKSIDGKSFDNIDTLNAKGSTGTNNYAANDADVNTSIVYYRIEWIDKNGNSNYSNIIQLNNTAFKSIISIFPNPAKDYAQISLFAQTNGQLILRLTDVTGRIISEQKATVTKGNNALSVNQLNKLSNGVYIIQLWLNNQQVGYKQLLKE